MEWIPVIYLAVINVVTFVVFAIDKRRAMKDAWRTPEKTLLGLSLAGGSIGALASMRLFRHKTKKPLFSIGIPVMLVLQAALVLYVLFKFN